MIWNVCCTGSTVVLGVCVSPFIKNRSSWAEKRLFAILIASGNSTKTPELPGVVFSNLNTVSRLSYKNVNFYQVLKFQVKILQIQ